MMHRVGCSRTNQWGQAVQCAPPFIWPALGIPLPWTPDSLQQDGPFAGLGVGLPPEATGGRGSAGEEAQSDGAHPELGPGRRGAKGAAVGGQGEGRVR